MFPDWGDIVNATPRHTLPDELPAAPTARPMALALLTLAWALMSGCVSVPDERELLALRMERAEERLRTPAATLAGERHPRLSGDLTLARALEHALTRNLALQHARQERNSAQGRIAESYGEVLPALDLTAAFLRRDEATGAPRDGASGGTRSRDDYSAGLRLSQPL
jgi:outer membrane protein TolC